MAFWEKLRSAFGGRGAPAAPTPAAPTPRDAFAAEAEAVFRASPGVTHVSRSADAYGLTVEHGETVYTVFLDNLFAETRELGPDARRDRVARLARSLATPDARTLGWDEVRPRLAPLLRTPALLGSLAVPPESRPIRRPFLPFLIECVGVDSDDGISYAAPQTIERWGVPASEVFEAATANGRAYFVDDVAPYDRDAPYPIWHVARDDSYESSRLLVPGWLASFAGKVRGRPVAIVPHRSLLVVGGDGDERCMARLVECAKAEFKASARPISPALYTTDDAGGVVPLVLPARHALATEVALGHMSLAADEYNGQKQRLEQTLKEDVFVASFLGLRDPEGRLTSYTTWAKGVLSLLPRVDLVVLGLEPEKKGGESLRVPWQVLVDVAGECLTREADLDPPRWRTVSWPSAERLAKLRAVVRA